MFKRKVESNIISFLESSIYKSQIILGVRQCGKTTLVKNIFQNYNNYVYCNLEENPQLISIFESNLNPERIIQEISLLENKSIDMSKRSYLIIDEIQCSNKALTSLKYFAESNLDVKVIALGSLLGIAFNESAFPVGKVDIVKMYPLSFDEFLQATNNEKYIDVIREAFKDNKISTAIHQRLLEIFELYLKIGSMPQVVDTYNKTKDLTICKQVLTNILISYQNDIGKYVESNDKNKILKIYNSIPSQLGKDNQKFVFKSLSNNANYVSYRNSFTWLSRAELCYECYIKESANLPLNSDVKDNTFKLFMTDTALLLTMAGYNISEVKDNDRIYLGIVMENYVATEIMKIDHNLYCYMDARKEIDFIINRNSKLVPVEVKAAKNTKSKSLKFFMEQNNLTFGIRVSSREFGFDGTIKSIPHYSVFCLDNL